MQNTIIRDGAQFTRINAGNYDVRQADGENFRDNEDREYYIGVVDEGDGSWSATLIYDEENVPESLPDYVQAAQEIEQEFQRAEEVPGMTAIKLMQQVAECEAEDWQNSDIGAPEQAELEIIADHFRSCQDCRAAFDAQDYPEVTIQEFAARLTGALEDWICNSEERVDWKKVEVLKSQINAWDCQDIGALRDLIEQATEALKDYNEKYPFGAGPGKIEELIDFTSLPSAELPADLAEHTDYPIWTADKSGACLVGAGADEVQTADEIREALDLPLPTKEA